MMRRSASRHKERATWAWQAAWAPPGSTKVLRPAPLNEYVDPFDGITLTAVPERLDCDANEIPTFEEVTTAFKEAWESLNTARYAIFRLLHFSEVAENVEELRNLPEHIERAMVKIGEIRKLEADGGTQTADTDE